MRYLEKQTVISGVGQSAIGRRMDRSALDLTLDACLAALDDAGLRASDIDGLSSWPGQRLEESPGFAPIDLGSVKDSLGLKLNWFSAGMEAPAQCGAIVNAVAAVAAGLARHVLVFRTVTESSANAVAGSKASVQGATKRYGGPFSWLVPSKAMSAANWTAIIAQRHFYEFGTTRETLGRIAINNRNNAMLNSASIFRDELTMDDYLAARLISTPYCLFDCDVPIDGSTALIVSHIDSAPDLDSPPVLIEAVGSALHGQNSWDNFSPEITRMAAHDAADMLWSRTDLKPKDVDIAQLYDGFTFLALTWIEALGFCEIGEAKDFIGDGRGIALDGRLPLNTGGGQLSSGRTHGFGLFHEAVLQLRGQAGKRQVGPQPKVAAVSNGGGPLGGAFLLRIE